ncbi:hypothetical protein HYDPIDRAFT_34885 [Hydnomerulius pinastri MD-312]|uniref:UDP-galactose transporter n=1 Tax=Hydnomerulius pinastri MD-312 TaxID=994086 RepID=A0A0C9VJS5_9AGAM|nr:hypothetical protein HYDPIDRAFT_34885 [Hydnomerulius pinastri MD-312]
MFPWLAPFRQICSKIFSADCWKLSIPAILYVVQNSLQFVAIGSLPVASFQVAYQMKILTTAAFSVVLLRKRLSSMKWLSLFFLAIGIGIAQVQTSALNPGPKEIRAGSAHDAAPLHIHIISPLKGFGAITATCFTSGHAGVYFEMVLKGSKANLWVWNIQLSLFSLLPAILPDSLCSSIPYFRWPPQLPLATVLGLADKIGDVIENEYFTEMESTSQYLNAPYGSPFPSRTPTP